MNLELIAAALVKEGLGIIGEDIFMHRMEQNCPKGILLKLPIDGIRIDQNLPRYHKTALQAIIRDISQEAGDAKAALVTAALTMSRRDFRATVAPYGLLMQVKQMYPTRLPIVYPRSDGRGIEWSVNLHADYVLG